MTKNLSDKPGHGGTDRIVHGYLDLGEETFLNRLTALAAETLNVRVAVITLRDGDQLWFKARHGLEGEGIALQESMSAAVYQQLCSVVVHDIPEHGEYGPGTTVYRELGLRFYAGTPITDRDGVIGSFCVLDPDPRPDWSDRETRVLEQIAELASMHLAFRQTLRERAGLPPGKGTRIGSIIEEIGKLHEDLVFQANHDLLTGVLNRRGFEVEVGRYVGSPYEGGEYSLLYLDLDQFKLVNDVCGHAVGDLLLQRFSAVVQTACPDEAVHARLGDDEFAVLIPEDGAAGERVAEEIMARARDIRFSYGERRFGSVASIGLVRPVSSYQTFQALLIAADSACHLAKEQGGNRMVVYDPEDLEFQAQFERMESASRVRESLDYGRFQLYRQRIEPVSVTTPVVDAAGADRVWEAGDDAPYYEVLLRQIEPDGSITGPGAVIPAAERFGLIAELDEWVLSRVLEAMAADPDGARYAVNLSGQSLNRPGFDQVVLDKVREAGIDPTRLMVEITETAAIAQLDRVTDLIDGLQTLGASVALDDFGSGFSSFGYLKKLHVDCVKIDGQFIRNLDHDALSQRIVESICGVNAELGVYAVAEFVETETVLPLLARLGVRYAQGFALHRPEPWVD